MPHFGPRDITTGKGGKNVTKTPLNCPGKVGPTNES
jgi:hypothetical protein